MYITDKDKFSVLPPGTVFSCVDFSGDMNKGICVKTGQSLGVIHLNPISTNDDGYTDNFSIDTALCDYDKDQLFAIYSKDEVRRMIDVLTYALCDCKGYCYTDNDNMVMN